jgi:ectoine hydroxylase-related dioxygenase (phytanoyl-CoA dioxygenase family)
MTIVSDPNSFVPSPQKLREFHEIGFTIVENVVPREEALGMRPLLEAAIEEDIATWGDKPGYIDHWMVHNLMVRGAPFLHLLDNPVMHAYLAAAFTPQAIIYAYTSSSMPPGGSNYSHRVHVDCPRVIPGYVTNVGWFMALDDVTLDNGPTHMLPHSQWREDAPSLEEFLRDATKCTPRAGDAIFFNARTWHMGGRNTTNAPRHAVTMNICRPFMKQRFDYPRLVPQALIDRLGADGQRFLGMHSRIPTSLEEYYVPPSQRLYRSGLE